MCIVKQYRVKAAEFTELLKTASSPAEIREFRNLEQSYATLAENDKWLADNLDKTNSPGVDDNLYSDIILARREKKLPDILVRATSRRSLNSPSTCSSSSMTPGPKATSGKQPRYEANSRGSYGTIRKTTLAETLSALLTRNACGTPRHSRARGFFSCD